MARTSPSSFAGAEGHYDRLPEMAADLVRRKVVVLAATGGAPSITAAKAATTTIPNCRYG
jgi:putative tryptophan/tyrosine transport system substrate-binding protein